MSYALKRLFYVREVILPEYDEVTVMSFYLFKTSIPYIKHICNLKKHIELTRGVYKNIKYRLCFYNNSDIIDENSFSIYLSLLNNKNVNNWITIPFTYYISKNNITLYKYQDKLHCGRNQKKIKGFINLYHKLYNDLNIKLNDSFKLALLNNLML